MSDQSDRPTVEQYKQFIQDGKFKAFKCSDCGAVIAPPLGSCYNCGSSKMEWTEVSGKGRLIAFTVIHVAPEQFQDEAPYYVAIVELDEGTRVTARLSGFDPLKPEEVELGIPMELTYETGSSGTRYLAFKKAGT